LNFLFKFYESYKLKTVGRKKPKRKNDIIATNTYSVYCTELD